MKYLSRRLVMPGHLNSANRLFGGRLLGWIDEEAYIFAKCQLSAGNLVTRYISEISFLAPAMQDDVVEIGLQTVEVGRTSITIACQVRNKDTGKVIVRVEKIVFVAVDRAGDPVAHGKASGTPAS
ncbi:MAG: acyl-CoA thioesterase [Chromatiales bacterium]|nr:acyl-CoA thioesterase [Chromatiales bacterium]